MARTRTEILSNCQIDEAGRAALDSFTFFFVAKPASFDVAASHHHMKTLRATIVCVAVVLSVQLFASAQANHALDEPRWNLGVFAVGGTGLQQDSDIHNFGGGARFGRVLTHPRGPGFLRGSLEWNAEVLPFHQFYGRGQTATGGIVNPLIVKWNFVTGHSAAPFFEVIGGAVFTNKDFPPGDTSTINFNSGAGVGMNIFQGSNHSIAFDVRALHISNASIGNHNPGVNASLQFTLGYTWWK
jgi:lipid A 3-O-deacylase